MTEIQKPEVEVETKNNNMLNEISTKLDKVNTMNTEYAKSVEDLNIKSSNIEIELKSVKDDLVKKDEVITALEKKLNDPSKSFNENENEDLKLYKKGFETYLKKGKIISEDLAKKGLTSIFGETIDLEIKSDEGNGFIMDIKSLNLEQKTMRVGVQTDGGYLTRPELSTTPITRIFETSPIRELASSQLIGSSELELIMDDDEASSGGWVGEEETRGDTNTPKVGKLTIQVKDQFAQPKATQKLLDDGIINVETWLAEKINEIITRTENTAFVNGTGDKSPKGILTYSAWASAGTYERDKLEYVKSGTNGVIKADTLMEIQDSLLDAYQANAVWIINRTAFTKIKQLKDGEGNYLLNTTGMKDGFAPMLLGKPIVFASDMPKATAFTTGTKAIIYGDIRAGYQIVDRQGINVLRDPFTSKPYVKFYTTKRTGGAVKNFQAIKVYQLSA